MDEKQLSEIISQVLKEYNDKSGSSASLSDGDIPVGVSNRHIHLTQEHLDILFGPGYQLTKLKDFALIIIKNQILSISNST